MLARAPGACLHLLVEQTGTQSGADAGPARALTTPVPEILVSKGSPCEECGAGLGDSYFLVNGHGVCAACEERLQGSFARALLLGVPAAGASVAVYYAVLVALDMRFVFAAVLAGVAVGSAVRKGAEAGRHVGYRWLAVALTYLAATAMYAHSILELPSAPTGVNLVVHALYLPLLMLLQQKNIVTLILLGFGLHEAWKFSAPPRVRVEGPFPTATE